uniref:N-acetyltransferase domain-containing protein n=1 Tax=Leersia perrieri TaxID=77586 RepID=A0A0D9XIT9_9ORYZ
MASPAPAPPSPATIPAARTAVVLPTMADIMAASRAQGLRVRLTTLGPFFRVAASRRCAGGEGEEEEELGRAQGMVRPWPGCAVLHLDSMRMSRAAVRAPDRPLFGLGLFLGAVAVRHGFDAGCRRAELLAINDTDLYHSKLVRFYTRMGFKTVHEVDGSSMADLAHMLVWGGRGTRMDADIEQLLIKWSKRFRSQD